MPEITLTPGSEEWHKWRRLATETIPGRQSALYFLNAKIRGLEPLIPMTYRAHLGMHLFAESATGIPEIDEARVKLILVSRGVGKALDVETPIPTPSGWMLMGDLEVGDLVYAPDGKPCKVRNAFATLLGRKCYEVEFDSGDKIVCDAEHLWTVRTIRSMNRKNERDVVMTTEEMKENLFYGPRQDRNLRIRLSAPVQGTSQNLSIHPYMRGVWLGDGTSAAPNVTCCDQEILDRLSSLGYTHKRVGNSICYSFGRDFFDDLKLLNVVNNKHIPLAYELAEESVRMELLRGLLDTDGYASDSSGAFFYNTNKDLATGVFRLMASLGLKPSFAEKNAYLYGRLIGKKYEVYCRPDDRQVFHLPRKQYRIKPRKRQARRHENRMVVAIREVETRPVRCIEVDHPSQQFLCGEGYIATHNSACVTKGLPILHTIRNPEFSTGIANEISELAESFLADIKNEFETNTLLQILFPEVWPGGFSPAIWKADRIITNRAKLNPTSPTVLAAGVGGTKTGVHLDMWVCDDLLSKNAAEALRRGNTGEIETTNQWITQLQPLLKNPKRDPLVFIGCIEELQPVLMADGTWKAIKDILPGDMVWATKKDGSEGFQARKVTRVWDQGEADIVEVDVAGRQLRCTPNHPILVSEGRADGVGRAWNDASKLKDNLINRCVVFGKQETDKTDPTHTERFAWLLGFMVGDGWNTCYTRKSDGGEQRSIAFCLGTDEALNLSVAHELRSMFPDATLYETDVGAMRMDSKEASEFFEQAGLAPGCGAHNKRVPEWVFQASNETKREFLRGLGDADGHWLHKNRYVLEVCSKILVEDVHKLAMTCGVRPTRITSRTRIIQPPHSPKPVTAVSYHVGVNFTDKSGWAHTHNVKSIKPAGRARVFDLTVEDGECAFVASGMVVGNTKWWDGDSYEFLEKFFGHGEPKREFLWTLRLPPQRTTWLDGTQEKVIERPAETQVLKLARVGELAIFKVPARDENRRPIFPERLDDKELTLLEEEDPVFFAGQYLLEPTAGAAAYFQHDWLRYYEWDGGKIRITGEDGRPEYIMPRDLNVFMSVDPAFSKKSSSARTAIPVTGLDGKRIFLLEDYAERVDSEDAIAAKATEFYTRYKPQNIIVETIVAQVAVANAIKRRFRELGLGEPPLTEIPGWGKQRKEMRIFGLEHYAKRGVIYIHRSHVNFIREYLSFPRGILRDVLDALAFQVEDWEKVFQLAHFSGGSLRSPQERAASDAAALDRVRRAWGRKKR